MKHIKRIQLIIILLTLYIVGIHTSHAQANGMTQTYTGTWQYDSNNVRFIIKIWQEGSHYYGHYKKVQLNNGIAGYTIYNSRLSDGSGGFYPEFTISTNFTNEYGLTGFIYDNAGR